MSIKTRIEAFIDDCEYDIEGLELVNMIEPQERTTARIKALKEVVKALQEIVSDNEGYNCDQTCELMQWLHE